MKETHDKNKLCVVVVTELSKVRNCLKNTLLTNSLHAFGFNYKSGRVIYTHRSIRIQVKKAYQCLFIYILRTFSCQKLTQT